MNTYTKTFSFGGIDFEQKIILSPTIKTLNTKALNTHVQPMIDAFETDWEFLEVLAHHLYQCKEIAFKEKVNFDYLIHEKGFTNTTKG